MVCRTRLWIKRKPKDPKKSGSIKHQESQPYDPPKVTKAKKKAGPKNEKDCEKEITPPLAPDSASWMNTLASAMGEQAQAMGKLATTMAVMQEQTAVHQAEQSKQQGEIVRLMKEKSKTADSQEATSGP